MNVAAFCLLLAAGRGEGRVRRKHAISLSDLIRKLRRGGVDGRPWKNGGYGAPEGGARGQKNVPGAPEQSDGGSFSPPHTNVYEKLSPAALSQGVAPPYKFIREIFEKQ